MPMFDYSCTHCGEGFEQLVRSARVRPACPRCGSKSATRLPSAPAIRGSSPRAPMLPVAGGSAHGCGNIERPGCGGGGCAAGGGA